MMLRAGALIPARLWHLGSVRADNLAVHPVGCLPDDLASNGRPSISIPRELHASAAPHILTVHKPAGK